MTKKSDVNPYQITFGISDGQIIMEFNQPFRWLGITRQGAIEMAQTLINLANKLPAPPLN